MAATKQTLGLLCCLSPFTLSGTLLWHLINADHSTGAYEPDTLNDKAKKQLAWLYQDFAVNNTLLVMPVSVTFDFPPEFDALDNLTQFLKEQSPFWNNTEIVNIQTSLLILPEYPKLLSALNQFFLFYFSQGKLVTPEKKKQYRTVIHLLSTSTAMYTWLDSLPAAPDNKIVELLKQFMNNPMVITEIGLAFSEDQDESLLTLLTSFPFLWPLVSNHQLSGEQNYKAVYTTVEEDPSLKKIFAQGISYFALTTLFHIHRDIFGINHYFRGSNLYDLAQKYLVHWISKYESKYGSFPITPVEDMVYTMINILVDYPELYYGARGFPVPQDTHLSLSYFFYALEEALQKEPERFHKKEALPQDAGAQMIEYFHYPKLMPVLNWLAEMQGTGLIKDLWAIPPQNLYALLVEPVCMTDALYGLSMLSFPIAFPQSITFDNLKQYLSNVLSSYYKSDIETHSARLAALLLKKGVIPEDKDYEESDFVSTFKNLYKSKQLSFNHVHQIAIDAYAKAPPPLSPANLSPVTECSVDYHLVLNKLESITLKDATERQLNVIGAMAKALSKLQIAESVNTEKQQRAILRQQALYTTKK